MNCTFCEKECDNIRVSVSLFLESERLREDDTWEKIPNMDLHTREFLCEECFSNFSEILSKEMNKKVSKNV